MTYFDDGTLRARYIKFYTDPDARSSVCIFTGSPGGQLFANFIPLSDENIDAQRVGVPLFDRLGATKRRGGRDADRDDKLAPASATPASRQVKAIGSRQQVRRSGCHQCLNRIVRAGRDLKPALKGIAHTLEGVASEAFEVPSHARG